jgi:predicted O-methyltransferase YrrM
LHDAVNRLDARLAVIDQVLADPPQVHVYDDAPPAPGGVWGTSTACYRFLATRCEPGARTLETGLGISTVLFAAWGASHTCIVGSPSEVDRCRAYLEQHEIADGAVRFVVGASDLVLPALDVGEIDVYLIDGGHAYPLPTIDWYYGARWLRSGGVVVFDDVPLPAVGGQLLRFIRSDPRWREVESTTQWAAFERQTSGALREEWTAQPFFEEPSSFAARARRALASLARRRSPTAP